MKKYLVPIILNLFILLSIPGIVNAYTLPLTFGSSTYVYKIIVAPDDTSYYFTSDGRIAKMNKDFTVAWTKTWAFPNYPIYDAVLRPDGSIVMAGYCGYYQILNSDGTLGVSGRWGNSSYPINSVAVRSSDGMVIMAGGSGKIQQLDMSNQLLTTYTWTPITSYSIQSVVARPDGSFVMMGDYGRYQVLNSDLTLGISGYVSNTSTYYKGLLQADGRILFGGAYGALVYFNTDNTLSTPVTGLINSTQISGIARTNEGIVITSSTGYYQRITDTLTAWSAVVYRPSGGAIYSIGKFSNNSFILDGNQNSTGPYVTPWVNSYAMAVGSTPSTITLDWTGLSDSGAQYYLEYSDTSSFTTSTLLKDWATDTTAAVNSLSPKTTYYFRMKVKDNIGIVNTDVLSFTVDTSELFSYTVCGETISIDLGTGADGDVVLRPNQANQNMAELVVNGHVKATTTAKDSIAANIFDNANLSSTPLVFYLEDIAKFFPKSTTYKPIGSLSTQPAAPISDLGCVPNFNSLTIEKGVMLKSNKVLAFKVKTSLTANGFLHTAHGAAGLGGTVAGNPGSNGAGDIIVNARSVVVGNGAVGTANGAIFAGWGGGGGGAGAYSGYDTTGKGGKGGDGNNVLIASETLSVTGEIRAGNGGGGGGGTAHCQWSHYTDEYNVVQYRSYGSGDAGGNAGKGGWTYIISRTINAVPGSEIASGYAGGSGAGRYYYYDSDDGSTVIGGGGGYGGGGGANISGTGAGGNGGSAGASGATIQHAPQYRKAEGGIAGRGESVSNPNPYTWGGGSGGNGKYNSWSYGNYNGQSSNAGSPAPNGRITIKAVSLLGTPTVRVGHNCKINGLSRGDEPVSILVEDRVEADFSTWLYCEGTSGNYGNMSTGRAIDFGSADVSMTGRLLSVATTGNIEITGTSWVKTIGTPAAPVASLTVDGDLLGNFTASVAGDTRFAANDLFKNNTYFTTSQNAGQNVPAARAITINTLQLQSPLASVGVNSGGLLTLDLSDWIAKYPAYQSMEFRTQRSIEGIDVFETVSTFTRNLSGSISWMDTKTVLFKKTSYTVGTKIVGSSLGFIYIDVNATLPVMSEGGGLDEEYPNISYFKVADGKNPVVTRFVDVVLMATDNRTIQTELKVQIQVNGNYYYWDNTANGFRLTDGKLWGLYNDAMQGLPLDEGINKITLRVKDGSENVGASVATITYVTETVAPTIPGSLLNPVDGNSAVIVSTPGSASIMSQETINGNLSWVVGSNIIDITFVTAKLPPEFSAVKYSVTGDQYSEQFTLQEPISVQLPPVSGVHLIKWQFITQSGIKTNTASKMYVAYDNEAPAVRAASVNQATFTGSNSASVKLTAKDNISSKLSWKINSTGWADVPADQVVNIPLNTGLNEIEIYVKDTAGNIGSTTYKIWRAA